MGVNYVKEKEQEIQQRPEVRSSADIPERRRESAANMQTIRNQRLSVISIFTTTSVTSRDSNA